MMYFVISTKHLCGSCLWDSQWVDAIPPNTPWSQNLLRPMAKTFRAEGLRVGLYYSLVDCHHPTDCHFAPSGKLLYRHLLAWPSKHLHLDGLAGQVDYA